MGKYFGTDGVRGESNLSLTVDMAYRIGRYLGQYPNGKKNRILVCRDTRLSGGMLLAALTAGLTSSGSDVFDEGVSTTPSVSYLVRRDKFDFGVMISASHNVFSDNGIKVFNREGEKLEETIELEIESYMDSKDDYLPAKVKGEIGQLIGGESLKREYITWLEGKADKDYSGLKVIVDTANGSASYVAPTLYKELGIDATFINSDPNGVNINDHCGSTHLESLMAAYNKGGYDLGLAFDGDSDRFMAIGPGGRLIDGDAMLYLSSLYLKKQNQLRNNAAVMTVMSNYGLRKALDEAGIDYRIVSVGDKNVQMEMKKEGLSVGGEQSGHVIFLNDLNTGDGLLSSLKLMHIFLKEKGIYGEIEKFKVYPQVLINVSFPTRDVLKKALESEEVVAEKAKAEKRLENNGRLLLRASGTEPLIRVMAESLDEELCASVVNDLVKVIEREGAR